MLITDMEKYAGIYDPYAYTEIYDLDIQRLVTTISELSLTQQIQSKGDLCRDLYNAAVLLRELYLFEGFILANPRKIGALVKQVRSATCNIPGSIGFYGATPVVVSRYVPEGCTYLLSNRVLNGSWNELDVVEIALDPLDFL